MKPGCIGKSNTNNLPGPTDMTENPYGKKIFFFFTNATQKLARVVKRGIAIEFQPREPIFEKCSHLREKGGVLTLKTPRWVCAYPYSTSAAELACSALARIVYRLSYAVYIRTAIRRVKERSSGDQYDDAHFRHVPSIFSEKRILIYEATTAVVDHWHSLLGFPRLKNSTRKIQ
jgi:hypothetical protein